MKCSDRKYFRRHKLCDDEDVNQNTISIAINSSDREDCLLAGSNKIVQLKLFGNCKMQKYLTFFALLFCNVLFVASAPLDVNDGMSFVIS